MVLAAALYYGAYKLSPPRFIDAAQTLNMTEEGLDPAVVE